MQNLNFLHISDLHLTKHSAFYKTVRFLGLRPLSVYNKNALSAIAEVVYKWQDRIDALFLSGDIVTSAVEKDLQRAFGFFRSSAYSFPDQPWLSNKREPTLSFFNKPIIVVPGNHDRYEVSDAWPSTKFDNHFSFCWDAGFGGIKTVFLPNTESPILCIISADFALEKRDDSDSPLGIWGQGRVYKGRLEVLRERTKSLMTAYPECAVLWMIHFAPKFEEHQRKFNKNKMLIDSDALVDAAKQVGVGHIFCGHTHESAFYKIPEDKKISIHCVGTSCCTDEPDGASIHYHRISLLRGKILEIKTINLVYNPHELMFL